MAIIRTNGYVQLRRGILEHVANGSMSIVEYFVYSVILSQADPSTGIWVGSAGSLSGTFSIAERTCRDIIDRLEKAGYIKRFRVTGRRGNYPILVHRYKCSDGAAKGLRVNALETTSYLDIEHFVRRDAPEKVPLNPPLNPPSFNKRSREVEKKRTIVQFSSADSERIYQAYPRHEAKGTGIEAIKKALGRMDSEDPVAELLTVVEEYAKCKKGTDPRYIPLPATWFNQKRYLDDQNTWRAR
jgi:DNA-binding Lrp family transcriptional regulator